MHGGMMVLQVVVAVIPGEALEIGAGYAFGAWEGLLLCLIGAAIGSAIIFFFVKLLASRWWKPLFPGKRSIL